MTSTASSSRARRRLPWWYGRWTSTSTHSPILSLTRSTPTRTRGAHDHHVDALDSSTATSAPSARRSRSPSSTVTGTIPAELDGRYLRNGPNPITDPDPATHHWFVGTGMVHGIRLRDGRAEWYRNRYPRVGDGRRRARRPRRRRRGAARRHRRRPEHERDRPRRALLRARRGRRPPGRARRRARHRRPVRLRRHAAQRLHGPPAPRPGHRRAARDQLLVGVRQPGPVHRRRPRRPRSPRP